MPHPYPLTKSFILLRQMSNSYSLAPLDWPSSLPWVDPEENQKESSIQCGGGRTFKRRFLIPLFIQSRPEGPAGLNRDSPRNLPSGIYYNFYYHCKSYSFSYKGKGFLPYLVFCGEESSSTVATFCFNGEIHLNAIPFCKCLIIQFRGRGCKTDFSLQKGQRVHSSTKRISLTTITAPLSTCWWCRRNNFSLSNSKVWLRI